MEFVERFFWFFKIDVSFHNLFKNLKDPFTPSLDHSKDCSGGDANIEKSLTVSAP